MNDAFRHLHMPPELACDFLAVFSRMEHALKATGTYAMDSGGKAAANWDRRVMKRAAIENLRIHDLSRTVGSWLAQNGHTLHLIGDVLNHRDPKTTAGYAYFQTQQRRDALSGHGDRVLTHAAPHLRAPAARTPVSASMLLPPEHVGRIVYANAQAIRHPHYFKRETLYDLVWMAPVFEIARRLGVSEVGLAKLCRRANIPLPGRGYWSQIESGQQIAATALPPAPQGLPQLLRIRGKARALTLLAQAA